MAGMTCCGPCFCRVDRIDRMIARGAIDLVDYLSWPQLAGQRKNGKG
jgi:hypothetical protein